MGTCSSSSVLEVVGSVVLVVSHVSAKVIVVESVVGGYIVADRINPMKRIMQYKMRPSQV